MSLLDSSYQTREGSEFIEYPDFSIEYRDASHRYWLHKDGERTDAISVTSALGILDKPALRAWYGKEDATAVLALERAGELVGIPTDQAIFVARQKGYGAEAKRDAGADRGTAVHEALRVYCSEGKIPVLGDFDESVRGYVQALCGWLIDARPEPLLIEQIVGSPKYGFAGRFDLIATVDGKRGLWDAKTSTRAGDYPESHAQLEGYRVAFDECEIKPVEEAYVLELDVSGLYRAVKGIGRPEDFLSVLATHRAIRKLKAALKSG